MSDEHWMFKRQMEWQKQRARLSWPEKIRLAESMREAALLSWNPLACCCARSSRC